MLWTNPTFQEVYDEIVGVFRDKRPDASDAPGSDIDVNSWTLAGIHRNLSRRIRLMLKYLFAKTASGLALDAWLYVMGCPDGSGGYGRIKARGGSATDGCEVITTGTTGDLYGEELQDAAGLIYQINEHYSCVAPGGETVQLDILAIGFGDETGASTNLRVGTALTFTSPPANVEEDAEIVVEMSGGVNREEDDAGRGRVLSRLQDPGLSGNAVQWQRWLEDADGVAGEVVAYLYECRNGAPWGYFCVDYVCKRIGYHRAELATTPAQNTLLEASIAANAPADQYESVRHLTFTFQEVDVAQVLLSLHEAASDDKHSDFDSATLNASVSSVNKTNQTVTADKNLTGYGDDRDVNVGDYVCIFNAFAEVTKVGVAGGLASDAMIEVDAWFDEYDATINPFPWPSTFTVATERICAGGGLIPGCYRAGFSYFQNLGPARTAGFGAAKLVGWDDTYRWQRMLAALVSVDQSIVDAAFTDETDYAPTDAGAATVPIKIPGELIIEEDYS